MGEARIAGADASGLAVLAVVVGWEAPRQIPVGELAEEAVPVAVAVAVAAVWALGAARLPVPQALMVRQELR
jgi:hypothetical protein